jgi:hypothetical protein
MLSRWGGYLVFRRGACGMGIHYRSASEFWQPCEDCSDMDLQREQIERMVSALSPAQKAELDRLLGLLQPALKSMAFAEQAAFIDDPARLKAALCTRRSGKSLGGLIWLLDAAQETSMCDVLFIGLTRHSTRRAAWKPGVKYLQRDFGLLGQCNETDLSFTLGNGSTLYLLGMDADPRQIEKLLGSKLRRVVIDEAGSFHAIDLKELVFEKLMPALSDLRGEVALIGTPTNIKRGLFYDLTNGNDSCNPGRWVKDGWSCHRWSAFQNPHMQAQWNEDIAQLKVETSNIEELPWFQQQYLGRWAVDASKLVYRYLIGRNDYTELPSLGRKGRWHYVLGIDLGYEDPTAFTVCAYHDFDRTLYVIKSTKRKGMDVTDVAERTKQIAALFELDAIVVDNANKQAVEELRRRHELPLTAADKIGKADFIEIMNAEFIAGRIKLHLGETAPLVDEYGELIWDDRSEKRKEEHPKCANHCTDATLYAWRYCYQYLSSEPPPPPPPPGSDEWARQEVERMERDAEAALRDRMRDEEPETEGVGNSTDWEDWAQ